MLVKKRSWNFPLFGLGCYGVGAKLIIYIITQKKNIATRIFYYNGEQYVLPFRAVFTPSMLPCLKEAAILQIEAKIDELNFATSGFETW